MKKTISKKLRKQVYDKYGGYCAYCGTELKQRQWQIDHIIAKNRFMADVKSAVPELVPEFLSHLTELDVNHIDNLNPSCRRCNNFKHSFDLEGFRREIGYQLERVNKYSVNYRTAKRFGQVVETPRQVVFFFELCAPIINKGGKIFSYNGKIISFIIDGKEHWIHREEAEKRFNF